MILCSLAVNRPDLSRFDTFVEQLEYSEAFYSRILGHLNIHQPIEAYQPSEPPRHRLRPERIAVVIVASEGWGLGDKAECQAESS